MKKVSIVSMLLVLVVAIQAFASDPTHDVTIDVHQCSGDAWFVERDGTTVFERQKLSHAIHFDLHSEERATVRVADPNPFVYSYKWQPGTATDTADLGAVKKFADSATPLVDLLKAFLAADFKPQNGAFNRDDKLKEAGVTPKFIEQYTTDLSKLTELAKNIDALKAKAATCDATKRAEVKATVKDWDFPALNKRLNSAVQTIDNASVSLLRADLGMHSAAVLVASLDRDSLVEVAQQDSKGSTIGDKSSQQNNQQVAPAVVTPPSTSPSDLEQKWQLVKNTETYAIQLLNTVGEFVKKAEALDTPTVLGTVDYAATQDQPATLSILKEGQDKPTDIQFVFHPYSGVALSVDAAVVYSLAEVRHYAAKPDGTMFKIARTDSGDAIVGTSVSAMLSVTPRTLVKSPVGVAFQLGFSPVKDKVGIFTGVGIRFFDLLTFGGGLALQQSQRLSGSLVENQSIASAADLKTHNQFKPAGYFTLTVKIASPKK